MLLILARLVLGSSVTYTPGTIMSLILFGGVVNVLGDYVALGKTRGLLRFYRRGGNIASLVALDFVSTIVLFMLWVGLAITVIYSALVLGGQTGFLKDATLGGAIVKDLLWVLQQPYLNIYQPDSPELLPRGQRVLLYSAFITTFLPSIWLWAALMLSPIVRLFTWATGSGLTLLGVVFDVHKYPFAVLGYLGASVIFLIGGLVWGAGEMIATLYPAS
jgi:hypothetical protein